MEVKSVAPVTGGLFWEFVIELRENKVYVFMFVASYD